MIDLSGHALTYQLHYQLCSSKWCKRCKEFRAQRRLGAVTTQWKGHGPYWYAFCGYQGNVKSAYVGKDRSAKSEEELRAALASKFAAKREIKEERGGKD